MNVVVRNYYLNILSMCGEIASLRAGAHAPAAPTTAGDELRRMISDGLIRYHRHQDRKRTFRICDPAGFEKVGQIDERLLDHAELLVGKKGARYSGSKAYRLKKRKEAELMFGLANAGIAVDGMRLNKDRSVDILSPSLTQAETIMKSMAQYAPFFISGAVLRHKENASSHLRREMSISTGTLFSAGGIYTTFVISSDRFRWYAASETSSANDIIRTYEDALDIDRRKDGRFRAILYTSTTKVAAELLQIAEKPGHKMNPLGIFKLSYISPLEDKEHAADITRMLTIPDWRRKADRILGCEPDSKYDGETPDGKHIHNLLCCNISKVLDVRPDVKKGRCRLIIHDWQKPILEDIYGTDIDAIILEAKHFRGLLLTMMSKREP